MIQLIVKNCFAHNKIEHRLVFKMTPPTFHYGGQAVSSHQLAILNYHYQLSIFHYQLK